AQRARLTSETSPVYCYDQAIVPPTDGAMIEQRLAKDECKGRIETVTVPTFRSAPHDIADQHEADMDLGLRGRTVLITGGSQGIGLAIARAFAAEGCRLHLLARTQFRLREAMLEIADKFGTHVEIHPIDVSIGDNARALARACSDVDILVNNAGAVPGGNLVEIDEVSWRKAWDLKVLGYINLA